jgi:hypothetical protein
MSEPMKDELSGEENDFFPVHYWFADATVEMIQACHQNWSVRRVPCSNR